MKHVKEVSGAGQGLSTGPKTGYVPFLFIGGLFAFSFVSQYIDVAVDNRVGPALDLARTHMDHPLDVEDPAIKALVDGQVHKHKHQQSIRYALNCRGDGYAPGSGVSTTSG